MQLFAQQAFGLLRVAADNAALAGRRPPTKKNIYHGQGQALPPQLKGTGVA